MRARKFFLIFAAAVVLSSCVSNNLPPVTEERLNEMLAEIVERESRIITEEESDTVIENKKEGYIYFNADTVYWSSSQYSSNSHMAWIVRFSDGTLDDFGKNFIYLSVCAVRDFN